MRFPTTLHHLHGADAMEQRVQLHQGNGQQAGQRFA
jgi:hypothetical protein